MSCSEKSPCWLIDDSKKMVRRVFVKNVSKQTATIITGNKTKRTVSTEILRNETEIREFFLLVSKSCA